MKLICSKCNRKYRKRLYRKTSLCPQCYKKKRLKDKKEWAKRYRYEKIPLIDKIDSSIRPHVENLIELGYEFIDASSSAIILKGNKRFDNAPKKWLIEYYSDKKITKIYNIEEDLGLINLQLWIYYDLRYKNVRQLE